MQGLHNDLQNLRTEFGAKITALESAIQFDVPVNFAFDDATVRTRIMPHSIGSRASSRSTTQARRSRSRASRIRRGMTYNKALSQRRADAVRDYLVTKGVPTKDLKTIGYGKTRLVVPDASHDSRARSRIGASCS